MEIGRDPDVYIKTVLTFGDKPAPTMAQIALRKTANENKAVYPKAAEVLEKSTYMDDICESVDKTRSSGINRQHRQLLEYRRVQR